MADTRIVVNEHLAAALEAAGWVRDRDFLVSETCVLTGGTLTDPEGNQRPAPPVPIWHVGEDGRIHGGW